MPGKLLIVDNIATNRIVLKAKLSDVYYDVQQAANTDEALKRLHDTPTDLVLVNGHLEDRDSIQFCKDIRTNPRTSHLPILMLCNHQDRDTRLRALAAGVSDILVRPIDHVVLLARLRSLLRTHESAEEHHQRQKTTRAFGFAENQAGFKKQARIHLATPDSASSVRWSAVLKGMVPFKLVPKVHTETLKDISGAPAPDVFVIAVDSAQPDQALRLVAEIRARASTRNAGILVVVEDDHRRTIVDAMDLGAHDVMAFGFDPHEMALRVSRLVSQKRLSDRLRDHVNIGLEAAVTDPLTGLFNRRYALPQINRICLQSKSKRQQFAIILADLDHFKLVNDRYGHAAGDAVLTETACRLRDSLRALDLVARIGGEEFLIALPHTPALRADEAAARLCARIRDTPFRIPGQNTSVQITISLGVVMAGSGFKAKSVEALIEQADKALYDAKLRGRDQVRFAKIPA
ncbi:MAG: diguanylate cyclase [Cognatishimia sp.]|uniref:diguanylate cyclase n=1 Tax=Cognatishimia sp. TaxID=2211648 RepID=UPI003B8D8A56